METLEQLKNRLKKIDEMSKSLEAKYEEIQEKINRLTFKGFDKHIGKVFKDTSTYLNRTCYYKILKFDRYEPESDAIFFTCLLVKFTDKGVCIKTNYESLHRFSTFPDNIKFIKEEEFQDAMNRAVDMIANTNAKYSSYVSKN